MTDNTEKLSGKVGLDTTDFKTGLAGMNRELRVIESGFRASSAGLGDWSKNASGLEMRIKSLTDSIDVQRQKVAAVRAEYERVAAEKGATSRAAQELEIKLNKETESLGKMESELRKTEGALKGVKAPTEEAGRAAEQSAPKWDGLKNVLGGVGTVAKATVGLLLGLVAGVAAVAVAVGGLVFSSGNAAAALVDMSDKTGISTTRLQELQYFGSQYKLTLDTIATSQARMTRSMATAAEGTGDAAEAWETLGVSVTNADGSLRDQQDVFGETIDALGKIENASERDALAMAIFGRGAQELNPLIKAGSDEMERLADEAHRVGAVMSEEDIAGLEAFDDTMAGLKLSLQGTLGTLSTAFLPGFQAIFGTLGGYLTTFSRIVDTFANKGGGTANFLAGITGLVTDIANDVAGAAPGMMQAGLGIVMGILNAIMAALPNLLEAGTSILTSLVEFIVAALPTIIPMAVQILLTLLDAIIANLPMLLEAGIQAVTALIEGLAQASPELVPAIVNMIGLILKVLIDNGPALITAGAQLIGGLAQGLANAVPAEAKAAIESFLTEMGLAIAIGAPALGPKIDAAITSAIKSAGLKIKMAGKSIVEGLWAGIEGAWNWLYEKIQGFIQGIIDAILKAEDAHSPAKKFMPAGRFAVLGFEAGMDNEFKAMNQRLANTFGRLAYSPAFAGGSSGGNNYDYSNNTSSSISIGGIQMPNMGPQTTLADIMEFLNKRG
jgi:hypothetical protein